MDLKSFIRDYPDFPQAGITFKDIAPLLKDAAAFEQAVEQMAEPLHQSEIKTIVSLESRGFIFGSAMAVQHQCGFVMVRKRGKLPGKTLQKEYTLEYGTNTFEMQLDSIARGDKVLIVDDVLATGGSASAVRDLVESAGAEVVGFSFLMELDFLKGREKLAKHRVHSVLHY